MKRVIVTADDFGIADEINRGIVDGHRRGIITSAAMLMNAPATEAAVLLARANPSLEIGIHLSIVEGLSLRGAPGTTTDRLRYFGDGLCLHRHWKQFLPRFLLGRIDLAELKEELRLQLRRFRTFFDKIPFANGTQHLHLLPGIQEIILDLAKEFGIGALRIPSARDGGGRWPFSWVLSSLGQKMRAKLPGGAPLTTDRFAGFDASGRLDEAYLLQLLRGLPIGTTEIMTHPGHDCPSLRTNLSWGYATFGWQHELAAVMSPAVRDVVRTEGIELIQFKDLRP